MTLKKRLTAVGLVALAAVFTVGIARTGRQMSEKKESGIFAGGKETLYLWYTDEALTSYLSSAAVVYSEDHDVRIVPVLESGAEYLEKINQASLESNAPDLYVISHDSLEKASLAGLADEVHPPAGAVMDELYMGTGLQAATYRDKIIGYPFYFETSALLYNKTYLRDIATDQLEAEADLAEGEAAQQEHDANLEAGQTPEPVQESDSSSGAAQAGRENPSGSEDGTGAETASQNPSGEGTASVEGADSSDESAEAADPQSRFSEEEIEARIQEILPATIQDIQTFADNYDAPEQVEGVFKWDVTDIFYNYFFVGDAIDMGGDAGWDTGRIDIYNLDAIGNMRVYQALNQFFSIETSQSDYDAILNEFMEGKLVFTIATTDAVFRLEHAGDDGLFAYDYGIALTPDIAPEKKSRSLSMTGCVAVNGYSEHKRAANDFACFLTSEYNDILFGRTGKVSAARGVDYGYEALGQFAQEYERSISMPKMLETSNFWVKLEVVFSQIWNGADANEKLKELSEQIMEQVTGEAFEEEYLEEPVEEESEETDDDAQEDDEASDGEMPQG